MLPTGEDIVKWGLVVIAITIIISITIGTMWSRWHDYRDLKLICKRDVEIEESKNDRAIQIAEIELQYTPEESDQSIPQQKAQEKVDVVR